MAVATSTAIAAGLSLAGAGANFAQANKQQRLMRDAQEEAAKYMEEARQKLGVNYAEELQVPLEGYEAAAKMNLAAGQQATDALRESGQRAVIGGTGRVLEQQNRAAEQLRFGMQEDLYERDRLIAEEDQRIAQQLAGLDLATVEGAQIAAADADMNRANAITGAISGITNAGLTAFEGSNLYNPNRATRTGMAVGQVGSLDPASVGRIAENSDLNYLQKRSLRRKGQESPFFDQSMFEYFDPNSIVAPDMAPSFSFPVINPTNPFRNG